MKRATSMTVISLLILGISIHALVKRATITIDAEPPAIVISIHALVKRATRRFS